MIEHLKRIISRLRASGDWLPPPSSPPEDPEIGVRQPNWRRPPGGSAAIAIAEPEDQTASVAAIGRIRKS